MPSSPTVFVNGKTITASTFPATCLARACESRFFVALYQVLILYLNCFSRTHILVSPVGDSDYCLSKIQESTPHNAVGLQSYRLTIVAPLADSLHDGNLSQQGTTHLLSQSLHSITAEDVVFVLWKLSRSKPGHVLNQAQYRHINLIICDTYQFAFLASANATC